MEQVSVRFEPVGVTVTVPHGSTAHAAAIAAGVRVDAPCGGFGRCGRCTVHIDGEVSPPTADEIALVDIADLATGIRLACRARLLADATITMTARGAVVVTEAGRAPELDVESPSDRGIDPLEGSPYLLGAVVDIGTTTIVAALVDLENGDELARAGALNIQYPWGADVMTRVTMAAHEGGNILHGPLVMQIERLILSLLEPLEAAAEDVREIAVAGNTAMTNSFLGEDLSPLASAPYEGAVIEATYVSAVRLGMQHLPLATCYVLPGVSAFIGADVVAGLLATRPSAEDGPVLFMDLGTNGELVLVTSGEWTAASAAAGPALEGAGIESGMRAEPGAIERVWLDDGELAIATIGGFPPVGVCGSGALDLIAVMLDARVLDASGRLRDDASGATGWRVFEHGDVRAFVIDDNAGLVLTQKDIRQLQLAKGAVRTAIDLLLAGAGVAPGDVREVLVAGGFGLHADGASLARIGMIPPEWADRLVFVGNTAKEGARAALVSSATRRVAEETAARVRTLSLATDPAFQARFVASLDFPA